MSLFYSYFEKCCFIFEVRESNPIDHVCFNTIKILANNEKLP